MKGMVSRPLLRWSPGRWFGVSIEWDPRDKGREAVIALIKNLGCAAWDDMSKTWWLPEHFYFQVEAELRIHYGDAAVQRLTMRDLPTLGVWDSKEEARRRGEGMPSWRDQRSPYATLGLTERASPAVIDAAFAALSRELDPVRGVGGSYEPLETVRRAYDQIKQAREAL